MMEPDSVIDNLTGSKTENSNNTMHYHNIFIPHIPLYTRQLCTKQGNNKI